MGTWWMELLAVHGGKAGSSAPISPHSCFFFFSSRRRHTRSVSAFLLNRSSDLQTSLGQFSGRVQQTYKHSVPRFFVPEHGTMFTLALVRFPPTATKEIQYLNAKGALTYTDIAGDPVLYGNLPPREISMK